MKKIWNY